MSYSFAVRAATKTQAKEKVAAEFEKAASAQICHERDKQQALAAANAFIDLLADDESLDVVVSMHGSLAGHWTGSDVTRITGASVGVNAGLASKEANKG